MNLLSAPNTGQPIQYVQRTSMLSKIKFAFFTILAITVVVFGAHANTWVRDRMKSDTQRQVERLNAERAKLPILKAAAVQKDAEAVDAHKSYDAQVNVVRGIVFSFCQKENDNRRAMGRSAINCEQDADAAFPKAG